MGLTFKAGLISHSLYRIPGPVVVISQYMNMASHKANLSAGKGAYLLKSYLCCDENVAVCKSPDHCNIYLLVFIFKRCNYVVLFFDVW